MGVRQFLSGRGSAAFQIGANLSVYVAWQCNTLATIAAGMAAYWALRLGGVP